MKFAAYVERVVVWVISGGLSGRVSSYGASAAEVEIIVDGNPVVTVNDKQLRDFLTACKSARNAMRASDEVSPLIQREVEE